MDGFVDARARDDGGRRVGSRRGYFLTLATRRLDRSIDARDRWTTRIANPRAMTHRDGAEDDDDDSMIRARVVSTRRRWTRARTTTVTTMCACAFFASVARGIGTGTPRAPAWSGGLARCAGGESSATTTNARGDVVAVGDGACAPGGRGVTFRSRGERLVSTSTTNGAIEAARGGGGGGAFTLAVAVEPSADAPEEPGVARPIVTFSTTLNESAWTHWCADEEGGYYLSLWTRDGWLETKARAPHPTAAFQCTSTRGMRSNDVPKLVPGRVTRAVVTYDPTLGVRVFIDGERAFPALSWGSNYAHEAAGDVPSTWTASSSRVVVGAYGDRSFLGTVHAVDVYDVALSDDELVEDASRPRWSPPPPPPSRDVVVVVGDDAPTDIALDARLSDPRDDDDRPLRFILLSLPTRGTVYVGSDDARVESVPRALERPTVRFSPAGESSAEEDASGEYARFHFEARESLNDDDDDDDGVAVERVVVRVRVVRANAAPRAGNARVVAVVGVPERVRLPFEDDDAVCPENVATCRGDRATSVRITRAPERGRLYACDDAGTMSRVVRDGTNVTSATADADVLCFAYVGDETSARDSFEYVVADESGAHSDAGTVSIVLESPCTLLRRTHDALEDETSTIEVTAACVGLNASTRVFASAVSSPMHGEITSEMEDVSLRRDACSDEQHATCGEWGVGASSASCFCGGFEYAPDRNYFNTPNKDVYGEFMATGPNGARGGGFGQPDIVRVTVRTSNGWITNPFIAYVNVRNVFDAPSVSIDGDAFARIERIAANTTSFALSGAVDIDPAPDYDASAMSVTMWSSYAKVLEIQGAAAAALSSRGAAANTVSLIGAPSAIADVLRNAQIAYAPKDTGKPAFDDEIQIRVVAGLRPVVGDFCREATKSACQFESAHDAPACDTTGANTSPCVVSASIRLPIADSPSYVEARDAASSGRSLEARARAVFLFWLIATPILGFVTYRASKCFWTRARDVGLGF